MALRSPRLAPVWLVLGLLGAGLVPARPGAAADDAAQPDAQMLLDLDLLKGVDFARDSGLLARLSILDRLRLRERLSTMEPRTPAVPKEAKER
jgi:hypothetical protein